MEKIAAAVSAIGVIATPIGVLIWRIVSLRRRWVLLGGVKCDLSELAGQDLERARHLLPTAILALREEAERNAALNGLNYRIHISSTDSVLLPELPAAYGTAYLHKDWPWSKKAWVVHAQYFNSRSGSWWFDILAHEIFAHLAYAHTKQGLNWQHEKNTWLQKELDAKKRLRNLLMAKTEDQ